MPVGTVLLVHRDGVGLGGLGGVNGLVGSKRCQEVVPVLVAATPLGQEAAGVVVLAELVIMPT